MSSPGPPRMRSISHNSDSSLIHKLSISSLPDTPPLPSPKRKESDSINPLLIASLSPSFLVGSAILEDDKTETAGITLQRR